jgi:hypothetical protein
VDCLSVRLTGPHWPSRHSRHGKKAPMLMRSRGKTRGRQGCEDLKKIVRRERGGRQARQPPTPPLDKGAIGVLGCDVQATILVAPRYGCSWPMASAAVAVRPQPSNYNRVHRQKRENPPGTILLFKPSFLILYLSFFFTWWFLLVDGEGIKYL